MWVTRREDIDLDLRRRIVAWSRHLMQLHGIESQAALARRIEVSGATISTVFNERKTPGLDYLVKLHRTFHVSADAILDSDPPRVAVDPGQASQPSADSARHRREGGR